ncbi:CLUMA_CG000681, isoform A [Clunio marinus]|uniref:CLUMA_CG000681, isoform A n=1 Tax=Clunio marinus TaxID=568069 RepID=A0A1J1HFV3_9DIPT|nr:CLUMA_CG000681, isoform A [Clunio marinus]
MKANSSRTIKFLYSKKFNITCWLQGISLSLQMNNDNLFLNNFLTFNSSYGTTNCQKISDSSFSQFVNKPVQSSPVKEGRLTSLVTNEKFIYVIY